MKKLMTIAAGLVFTGAAFANTVTMHNDATFSSADYATKAEALNAGYDIAENLSMIKQAELRKEFSFFSENPVRNVTVAKTEIKTEEFARTRNNIQYRAIVSVDYNYVTHESNDD